MRLKSNAQCLQLFFCWALLVLAGCQKPATSPSKYVSKGPFRTPQERQALFQQLDIQYTSKLLFDEACNALSHVQPEDYKPYAANKTYYDDLTARYGALIAKGHVANVSIRWVSDQVGYGIFAEEDIQPGDLVVEYTGKLQRTVEDTVYSFSYPPDNKSSHFKAPLPSSCHLNAMHYGNEARFANHSDDPNLETKFVFQGGAWHIIYVAKKKIPRGKQLLINYGSGYWRDRQKVDL